MTTRRTFIGTTAAALAATATRATRAEAHLPPDEALQQGTMPPAIAALTPMTAGVKPITVDERRARIDKATRLMREQSVGAIMLTGGTSLDYFTNIRWGVSERMLALIIPTKGTPFIVCPKFEEERAMEQVARGPMTDGADVYAWEESEDPYALIANGLRSRGLATATIRRRANRRVLRGHGRGDTARHRLGFRCRCR